MTGFCDGDVCPEGGIRCSGRCIDQNTDFFNCGRCRNIVGPLKLLSSALIFRSFCNLSTKVLPPDQLYDIRGQPMRSKLISLHLIHTLLNNHLAVFTSPLCTIKNSKSNEPTTFLQAIKFYLCLSITRNGASSVDRIFNICTEIFWLMLKYMRASFKVCLHSLLRHKFQLAYSFTERNRSLSQ